MNESNFKKLQDTLSNKPVLSQRTNILDVLFVNLNDGQIQLILRDTDLDILIKALAGASGEILLRVYSNMGDRGALILNEDIDEYSKNYDLDAIIEAQNQVRRIHENHI